MANLYLIKALAESKNIPITQLAQAVGVSEQQIHLMVRKNSTKIETLEKIARVLNVSVSVFFDEDTTEIRQAGRDYVEDGKIEHKGTEYNGPVTIADEALRAENERLKEELLEARKEIINLMKEKR
ncbi:helix-turn-helix domain-containing protein [Paramuribaculum intestinale]|uniref:helix-turn-helix domain-containing protein n=1 Tax=Paramuribaculum intestinale TaxID=2094151 RepID=UPI00272DC464|nr:helix-turn-helix transcriptional regulator [Paramuribaculum intestinale]